jgi:hypothetical protein
MVAAQSHESVRFTDEPTSKPISGESLLRSLEHGRPRVAVEGEGGRLSGAASLHVLAPGHTRAEVTALYRESDALDDAIRIAEDMERWNGLRALQRARKNVEERIALARGEG